MRRTSRIALFGIAVLMVSCGDPAVKRANAALAMGDGTRAARDFTTALDQDPTDTALRRGLGEALILVAREKANDGDDLPVDWSRAARELERSGQDSTVETLIAEASLAWARSVLRRGDTDLAVTGLEARMDSATETRRERNLLAILLDHRGERDRAADLFLENAQEDSTDADAWFNLAMVEWARKRRIQAAEHLILAAKHAPEDPEILYWLGKLSDAEPKR
ncbi:MAG: tetratricopeptide repeat protein [Fibrobacterota bacterium]|nr:MAG: tetratricopeptide repeat protein [Fibrobacterota bacterium]